jgi:hypothetical protein
VLGLCKNLLSIGHITKQGFLVVLILTITWS